MHRVYVHENLKFRCAAAFKNQNLFLMRPLKPNARNDSYYTTRPNCTRLYSEIYQLVFPNLAAFLETISYLF